MILTSQLWKRVLKLKEKYDEQGLHLSRGALERELNGVCSLHDVRALYDLLKALPVILEETGLTSEAKLTAKVSHLNSRNRELLSEVSKLSRIVDLKETAAAQQIEIPKWELGPQNFSKVTACAMLSDTHFDEYVDPAEINGINSYNRVIATERLKHFFKSLVKLRNKYLTSIEVEQLVLMLAGDMVSGIIHDELRETNEFAITDTLVYYTELMCAGLLMLAEAYGKIFVPCVVGNHGRLTQKVRFKGAVKDNFDYLFYHMISSALRKEKRVTFAISESPDYIIKVYDTTFLLTHGNDFRGGSGWTGPLMPVLRGDMKKRSSYSAVDLPYDVLCTGHFHTMKFMGDQIMSGSLCGFNQFALRCGCKYEPPQLPFWITHPKHGVTITAPIHCE